jgi:hypothetical protein
VTGLSALGVSIPILQLLRNRRIAESDFRCLRELWNLRHLNE